MASGQNISPSPGTPDHGGGGVMGMGGGASGASSATNPRKFSEKIALHKQREAEEKKEFEKMMNELKAVKGPSPQRTVNSGNMLHQTSSPINMGANAGPGGGFNMSHHQTTANAHQRHLSPHMPSGVIRHGSLPNVNAAMGLQMPPHMQHVISSEEFPLILNSQNGGVNATLGLSGSHVSVRDTVQGTSTGPIRNRSRMNTSPYGSDRHSPGGYHLSPPDPSWRRVVSDSAIHKSANEAGRSPDGSDGGGCLLSLVNGGQNSPLRGASPTVLRRVQANSQHRLQQQQQQQQQHHHHHQMSNSSPSHNQVPSTSMNESDVQSMDHTSNFLLPQDKDGPDKNNPGSLPDLTNFHVNASPLSGHQAMENEDQGSYSSSPATGNSPGTMAGTQWSPGTVPSSPHSPILTVSTAPPDPHINTSPLPTTPIPISQFQNHEQVFFPNSLPNVSMMGMNPVVTGNQYFADKQGCPQSTASLPVTPWLHKRYPHLAHSPSPIIHESADNLFFGRDDFSVQQPLRSMGSVPATVVVSSNASSSDVVLKQTCCSSTSSVVSSTTTCTSSSPRHAQHPGGNVRLSDSDICKILSIPMNLVADPYSGDDELIFEEPPDLLLQPTPNLAVTSQTMSVVTNAVPRGGGGTGGGGGGRDLDCSSSSSPQISSSSNGTHYSCDKESTSSPGITTTKTTTTEERNFLHFSKGMTTDQSAMNHLQYGYQNQQHQNIPNGSKSESLTNYRSTNVHSPAGHIQGSPHGRSASPVDMVGSPNSPGVLGSSPSRSPPAHSPMSGGGTVVYARESQGSNQRPNAQGFHHQQQQQQQQQQHQHQAQSELAKDFQKFSVMETSSSSTNAIYCHDVAAMYNEGKTSHPNPQQSPQPINDFSGYFNNYASDMNGKANQLINNQPCHPPGSMAPQTPQTPSSIPDIIFTDVDDDGSTNFHGGLGPSFDADSWSQELSANMADIIRDDTMFKLLSEGSNSPFDQQISDTLSEEHFAS